MRLPHRFVLLTLPVFWAAAVQAADPGPPPPAPPDVPPPPPTAAPADVPPPPPAAAPAPAPAPALPPPAAGKIDLQTQAPGPVQRRVDHVHDGFYLRVNAGLGYLRGAYDSDSIDNFDLRVNGFALSFDALVGGSPSPGIAVGGGILTSAAPSANVEFNDVDLGNSSMGFGIAGAFVDGFFNPRKGWHLGGLFGVARLDVEDDATSGNVEASTGVGGAAWIGHDFWVADQWSTGILFRVAGAFTRNGDDDFDASAVATSFMFTALYH